MKMRMFGVLMVVGFVGNLLSSDGDRHFRLEPNQGYNPHANIWPTQWINGQNCQVGVLHRYVPTVAKNWVQSLRETNNPTLTILSGVSSFVGIFGLVDSVLRPMNQASLFYYTMWSLIGSLGLQATCENDAPWYRNAATPPIVGLLAGCAMRLGFLPRFFKI